MREKLATLRWYIRAHTNKDPELEEDTYMEGWRHAAICIEEEFEMVFPPEPTMNEQLDEWRRMVETEEWYD